MFKDLSEGKVIVNEEPKLKTAPSKAAFPGSSLLKR